MAAKGASCMALAIYCWRRTPDVDGKLLAAILAISAVADIGLEREAMVGAALFACANLLGVVFYMRHRRGSITVLQNVASVALASLTPFLLWLSTQNIYLGLYGLTLGAMAGAAWTSMFSRYRVGMGMLLLIVSHALFFAGWAGAEMGDMRSAVYWPTYIAGQVLIVVGIVRTLRQQAIQQ